MRRTLSGRGRRAPQKMARDARLFHDNGFLQFGVVYVAFVNFNSFAFFRRISSLNTRLLSVSIASTALCTRIGPKMFSVVRVVA